MKARKYSTTCTPATKVRGARGSVTRPVAMVEPLAMRIVPPAARTSWWLRKGRASRCSASASTMVSASMTQTRSPVARFKPTLSASALPPFTLSTTSRLGCERDRYSPRTGLVSMRFQTMVWMGTRSKRPLSTARVVSGEPSLMTTSSTLA